MDTKKWIALAVVVSAIIVEIVLVFTNPWASITSAAGLVVGAVVGYLLGSGKVTTKVL